MNDKATPAQPSSVAQPVAFRFRSAKFPKWKYGGRLDTTMTMADADDPTIEVEAAYEFKPYPFDHKYPTRERA